MNNKDNIYTLDGKVPLTKALPFGFQHILTMFLALRLPLCQVLYLAAVW